MSSTASAAAFPKRPTARPFGLDYLLAVGGSWLVPGFGHFYLGHWVRGATLGATILGLFWIGQGLSDCRAVTRELHPIFFCGQVGNGLSALYSNRTWGSRRRDPDENTDAIDTSLRAGHNTGILFTTISGLLNMLLILHVADPQTWKARGQGATPASPAIPGKEKR